MIGIFSGALVMGSWTLGLFFFRFWQRSGEQLFGFFGAAFSILGATWLMVALLTPSVEHLPYIYLLRLVAFGLIAWAIVDKNRRSR